MVAPAYQVVRRINSERLMVLGWSRAVLLQVAHPLIAAGVVQHSSFRGSAVQAARRLHHTVNALLSLTFERPHSRAAAVAHIRGIHTRVNGTLAQDVGRFARGTRYSAEDPALLLWVHATLVDSTADIYQRLVAPLSQDELDALCAGAAPLLHELGGDPRRTPLTWASLQAYVREIYDGHTLAVSEDARVLGQAVLAPRAAGVVVPFSGTQARLTVGLLPPHVRDLYGFRWDAAEQRRFDRTVRMLRALRRASPRLVAHWRAARS